MTTQNRVSGEVDDVALAGRPATLPEEVEQAAEMVSKLNSAFGVLAFGVLININMYLLFCPVFW